MMKHVTLFAICLMLFVGCNKESAPPAPTASAEKLPADLFATTPPAGAIDVVAARNAARDGESIVVKGRIAGARDPIAANRAIMTLADASLPTCETMPGDTCATPWDACCEPSDQIAAKSVSVHVVGADGRPIKATLGGPSGLAPLKHVIVAGVIRMPAGSDSPVIEAKQIYVQR